MLINLQDIAKTIGAKALYEHLDLMIQPGEKVGLIGRNGVGKTTLLGIMAGTDTDFSGQIDRRRGLVVVATAQEHASVADQGVLEYVLGELPEYAKLKHDLDHLPAAMNDDMALISRYTTALDRFGELGYYDIEERVLRELDAYGIDEAKARGTIGQLSGGQKRFVELVKVTMSNADLALIDEPTNHMDYVAKEAFIKWLSATQLATMVITHDRDVLQVVDRIFEMRGKDVVSFNGNYDAYLKQNSQATMSDVGQYELALRSLENLRQQIQFAAARKAGSPKFATLEQRYQHEYDKLAAKTVKPSFWIDQQSVDSLKGKAAEKYDKYKARNIRLGTGGEHRQRDLVKVTNLSLGYDKPLFEGIHFELAVGERLQLRGRNGVGKSTLIKQLLAVASGEHSYSDPHTSPSQRRGAIAPPAQTFAGQITVDSKTIIGLYEQEIDEKYLSLPLGNAIMRVYQDLDIPMNDQSVRKILADYLFDPFVDIKLEINKLSGGQKARFQLIKMLSSHPNLLILDEPTNHLDLPSIEELEKALERYQGAILYVSHDSYFVAGTGGEVVNVTAV